MGKPKTAKEYEQLGRTVAAIYESGYLDRKQMLKTSLFKGALAGFGGVLGATVLIAILLWVLSLFSQVPLVGRFANRVTETINSQAP